MKFKVRHGNFLKSSNSTNKMMKHLIISLIPIILFAFYKNGILPYIHGYTNVYQLFKPLIMVILSCLTCFFTEYCFYKYVTKDHKNFKDLINNTYSIIPGIFLSLILPVNTSLLILIIGSVFASFIGKLVYGGFGHNIFNPALVGRLFVIASYGAVIMSSGGYYNIYESVDAVTSATPLANLSSLNYVGSYEEVVGPYGSLLDLFLGKMPGALGEVSKLLIILAFIYLVCNKVLKWRISISYLFTVFVMSFIIGIINGEGLWYPMFHILTGGLMFGAVFMATDPVTSPISNSAGVVYGICLGILTIFFRFLTPYPEGVLSSILFMNLLVPIFNNYTIKNHNKNKCAPLIFFVIVAILLSGYIGFNIKNNDNASKKDEYLQVINETVMGNTYTYDIKYKGFTSKESIEATVTIQNDYIIDIMVTNTLDHYYDSHIKNTTYIKDIINNQNNLDNVDTISGATYTSSYLKEMTKSILKYHGDKYEK